MEELADSGMLPRFLASCGVAYWDTPISRQYHSVWDDGDGTPVLTYSAVVPVPIGQTIPESESRERSRPRTPTGCPWQEGSVHTGAGRAESPDDSTVMRQSLRPRTRQRNLRPSRYTRVSPGASVDPFQISRWTLHATSRCQLSASRNPPLSKLMRRVVLEGPPAQDFSGHSIEAG